MARKKKQHPSKRHSRFRKKLRMVMKLRNAKPKDLARQAGVTPSHVYAILAGEKLPSLKVAETLIRGASRFSKDHDAMRGAYVRDYFAANEETRKVAQMAAALEVI